MPSPHPYPSDTTPQQPSLDHQVTKPLLYIIALVAFFNSDYLVSTTRIFFTNAISLPFLLLSDLFASAENLLASREYRAIKTSCKILVDTLYNYLVFIDTYLETFEHNHPVLYALVAFPVGCILFLAAYLSDDALIKRFVHDIVAMVLELGITVAITRFPGFCICVCFVYMDALMPDAKGLVEYAGLVALICDLCFDFDGAKGVLLERWVVDVVLAVSCQVITFLSDTLGFASQRRSYKDGGQRDGRRLCSRRCGLPSEMTTRTTSRHADERLATICYNDTDHRHLGTASPAPEDSSIRHWDPATWSDGPGGRSEDEPNNDPASDFDSTLELESAPRYDSAPDVESAPEFDSDFEPDSASASEDEDEGQMTPEDMSSEDSKSV